MAHDRRFRFGVQLAQPFPGMSWAESARRVEDLGYTTLFLPDHFGEQLSPIAAMTAAAAATDRLVVGSLVFDNDYRHPVVLAKETATIDHLFEGRVEVGLGAGWMRTDYETSGIPMDRPGVRVDRMMEATSILRGLWSGDAVDHHGEHYRISDLVGHPAPHTPCGPPLLLAGGAPRMLRFAGQHADIVGVNPSIHSGEIDADAARDGLADRMDQKLSWVRDAAGERFDDLELNAWIPVVAVTDDATSVVEMVAPMFGLEGDTLDDVLDSPMTLIGTEGEIAERILARRERWGFSYHVVQTDSAEALAPVVAALSGT
jgi:probable F420-dependent oxidoreductase